VQNVLKMINTNITGLIAMTRAISPSMVARNTGAMADSPPGRQ
jgi:NADP-dependent 3-hydroxy acid dehydrogenase YdfG